MDFIMTMHLEHHALTINGKKKGKQKFRNADQARKARELEESWKELQKKWGIEQEEKKRKREKRNSDDDKNTNQAIVIHLRRRMQQAGKNT